MKKAVIYARFSSEHQHQESIEAQVAECREYCAKKGYMVVKVYADRALSGTETTKRDSYNAMLADARKGLYDVVVFHKIDRNARNEVDYYRFKAALLALGLTYEYVAQPIDATPEGQFMEAIMVGQAAYYSRNLSKETKLKALPFAHKSSFLGGVPPYGYKIDGKRYVIDETEAPAVRILFAGYLAGKSYARILDDIHAAGYRTRKGRLFTKTALHDMLRNSRYCGTYTYNKVIKLPNGKRNSHSTNQDMVVNRGSIPAIVSESDYARVQVLMDQRRHRPGAFSAKREYLLSGKIRCGVCGKAFIGRTDRNYKTHKEYHYYQCSSKRLHGHKEVCDNIRLRADETEEAVINAVLDNLTPSDIDDVLDNTAEMLSTNNVSKEELKALQTKREGIERRISNLYATFEHQGLDEFDIAIVKKWKEELRQVEQQIAEKASAPQISYTRDQVRTYWNRMLETIKKRADLTLVKSALNILVTSITVTPEDLVVVVSLDVAALLVPGTGIEPVRVSLPEGF